MSRQIGTWRGLRVVQQGQSLGSSTVGVDPPWDREAGVISKAKTILGISTTVFEARGSVDQSP